MSHQLSGVKRVNGLNFWILSNKTIGTSFEVSIFDYDLCQEEPFYRLSEIFNSLKNVTLRIEFRGKHEQIFIGGHKRSEELAQYGSKKFSLFLHFESRVTLREINNLENSALLFLEKVPLEALERMGFSIRNLSPSEIPQFLLNPSLPISLLGSSLDMGLEYVSVIKLEDPKDQISSTIMDIITKELPCPYEIKIQLRTPEPSKVAMQFKMNVKREAKGGWFSSGKRLFSNKEALERLELEGVVYHAFEWNLVLRRPSLSELKRVTSQAIETLTKYLGEVSLGAASQYSSLESTFLGENFHSGGKFDYGGILETHSVLPYFLPINLKGSWHAKPEMHSLGIHRFNHTIDFLNLFDSSYKSYSAVIVGQTGFGKSVFLSQLIRSLHYDEKTKIIIIDVKGSNRRVVESLNGELLNINLNEPSGFNPFQNIRIDASEDTLNILKEFVASLCLEETENTLPEKLSAIIGIALKSYASSFKRADLKEFINVLPKDFERLPHLSRFTDGIEAKVFQSRKKTEKTINDRKLTYYYLEKIETASNRSLRKAMVNAVLMEFYLLLRSKAPDEKVIFICDEAPFFIQDAFAIFSMLVKTMRSQKGSLVLAVQYSSDLLGSRGGTIDESLINQAATKILFTHDGEKELFKERFQLSESEFSMLDSNRSVKGQYSQSLFKDTNGSRLVRLYLTDTEFWESGTEGVELSEIMKLKNLYPELNDREVAIILDKARIRGKLYKNKKTLDGFVEEEVSEVEP